MRMLTVIEDENHRSCVTRVPIFAQLTPDQQEKVGSFAHPVKLPAGGILHGAGEPVGQLFVVHAGRVKVVHSAPSGRTQLLRVVGPGEVVGEHDFLTGERPDYYVEAAEDAQLCVFDHADLGRLVTTFPAIGVEMLRSLSNRTAQAERRISLGAVDVVARVASYLLDLPGEPSKTGFKVQLPMPKKDVASWLGTTPESFSRALARLSKGQAIKVDGDTVHLLGPLRLEELASV